VTAQVDNLQNDRGFQNVPSVVPAECITYLRPDFSIRRCTSAIWEDTEGEEVPIWDLRVLVSICKYALAVLRVRKD
jgi:hypothetical protein